MYNARVCSDHLTIWAATPGKAARRLRRSGALMGTLGEVRAVLSRDSTAGDTFI
jgi:hypothetical protein